MNDRFIRKYSHDLPEKVVKNCPEFAGAQRGKAAASGGGGNNFRNIIVPVLVAVLVVAGIASGLVMANYMKNRRPDKPDEVNLTNTTPDATEPGSTPTIAPAETPAPTETAVPTGTPETTATPEPTETPTDRPAEPPLFERPKLSHRYDFKTYDQLAALFCEESFGFYKLLRKGISEDYGERFNCLVQLFTDEKIKPMAPVRNGERPSIYSGSVISNDLFNLPWIQYFCRIDDPDDPYFERTFTVNITYLDLIEGHDLSGKSIAEVIALLDPSIPLPQGGANTSNEEYTLIRNMTMTMRDGAVKTIVLTGKKYDMEEELCLFIMDGCIVCVEGPLTNVLFNTFSISPFEGDTSQLPAQPAVVPRSTDSSKISREEAKMLIRDGVDIVYSMWGYFRWYEGGLDSDYNFANLKNSFGFRVYRENGTARLYRPVKEGYDAQGVKTLVNKTFVKDIAAAFNSNDQFYDTFTVDENGISYFGSPYGAQYSYYYNFAFTEEDLDNLVLDEKTGTGWLRTKNIGMYDTDSREGEVTISVSFVWENGWKLASMNTADAALREYASGFEAKEFNVDNARRIITTVLCDLYMWTRVGTEGLQEVSLFDGVLPNSPERVYRGARTFERVAGTLSDPGLWRGYADRFLTGSMTDRILNGGNYLLFTDDAVYYWDDYSNERDMFSDYAASGFKLEVLNVSDTRATVCLSGWDFAWRYTSRTGKAIDDDFLKLDFEFELVGGVWKISGGNFIDRLDVVFTYPETEPYSADLEPSLVPPAPGKDSWSGCIVLFRNAIAEKAYNVTTYRDVHLKPGEALKIPVFWSFIDPLPEDSYELSIEFGESDAVRFEMLSKDEAPECEACFVATALKPGKATVRLYGSYDPDKLGDNVKGLSSYGKDAGNLLIDVELTVYVEG